ncbi:MAG: NACHT domain-containing protein [Nitrospira sp. SB0678_bin_10]|nr:NACHT domain-containing protein [Nitrospira sp. SB0678_bin_10]
MSSKEKDNPATLSRFKKLQHLMNFSENEFRDLVVRPLFLLQGFQDGRDLCGPHEKGKDAIFVKTDPLGIEDIYSLQTKKGPLNLTKKANSNVVEAVTQLKTALETKVFLTKTKEKKFPIKAILCASGKINEHARQHIVEDVDDQRIGFLDGDDLIPLIDKHMPEFWLGLDAESLPYLKYITQSIESQNENLAISDLLPKDLTTGTATDKIFIPLYLYRIVAKIQKSSGQVSQTPGFENISVSGLLKKRGGKFLILGDAGSGKSTCIRRLAYILAQKGLQTSEDSKLPVMLRASEIAEEISENKEVGIAEICLEVTKRLVSAATPCFSIKDLRDGKVMIFIDGLDEISSDASRKKVLNSIEKFSNTYANCKVVITSRENPSLLTSNGDSDFLKEYVTYYISPIDLKQASQLVDKLQKQRNLSSENSKEIIRRLQQIHGMELNPLLVTVFVATSGYSKQDIPANVTELFKKYTEMMLGRWDASKGLTQQYHAPLKDFIVTQIAYEMHRREITNIELEEFKKIAERELEKRGHKADFKQIMEEIFRSGLFRVFEKSIEFRHLLLQEFFAGRGIPTKEILETLVSKYWWQRAIVFYFGNNPSEIGGIEHIVKTTDSRPLPEIYSASLTVGLALQACYLTEVKERIAIFKWVIESISNAKEPLQKHLVEKGKKSLTAFLDYYLFSRDSLALNLLSDNMDEFEQMLLKTPMSKDDIDTRKFWLIIGLIENGDMVKAEKLIRDFHPNDPKLLLGVHMGCSLVENLRITSKLNKQKSEHICQSLNAKIRHLRLQLLEEFKSELLEVQEGQIQAIPKEN